MIRVLSLLLALAVCACASPEPVKRAAKTGERSDKVVDRRLGVSASPYRPLTYNVSSYKVGEPYKIAERWYRPKEYETFSETGIASWYGHKFHSRQTANGEVFNMYAMTAAHRVLPLPSVVRVTNLSNDRSAVVRINDRGPYANERIIDLSLTAAEKLGFRRKGVTRVRIELLPELSRKVARIAKSGGGAQKQDRLITEFVRGGSPRSGVYYVQTGTFRDRKNAEIMADRLRRHFDRVQVHTSKADNGRVLHRVRIGPESTRQSAAALQARVKQRGPRDAFVVRSTG